MPEGAQLPCPVPGPSFQKAHLALLWPPWGPGFRSAALWSFRLCPLRPPQRQLPGVWVSRQVCGWGPTRRIPTRTPGRSCPLADHQRRSLAASLPWGTHSWFFYLHTHLCESCLRRAQVHGHFKYRYGDWGQGMLVEKAVAEKLGAGKHSAWSRDPGRTCCMFGHSAAHTLLAGGGGGGTGPSSVHV